MPHPKTSDEVEREDIEEVDEYKHLVYKIRESKKQSDINIAFEEITNGLDVKIKKLASKFKIPGMSFDDVYQECLFALQYKAIKDFNEERGIFVRFAHLCIKRHLTTVLKSAHQNKKRILNESKSLDQDRSNDNEDLTLINLVEGDDHSILDGMELREFIRDFSRKLLDKLSKFEQEVFVLYVQKYSYEEIAHFVVGAEDPKAIKAIDNGLSRIKHKGWQIYEKMVNQGNVPQVAMNWFEEELIKKSKTKKQ